MAMAVMAATDSATATVDTDGGKSGPTSGPV